MIREYDKSALPASGPALLPDPPGPGRGIRYEYDTTALPASGPALLPGPRGPGRVLPHLRGSRLVRSRPKPVPSATGGYTALAHESGSGREANGGAILSLLTIARLPPGHDPGAVAGGAPAARQRGLRPCDIMVLGVNQVGTEAPEAPTGDKRYRAE